MSEIKIGEFSLLFFGVFVLNIIAEIWNWKKIKKLHKELRKIEPYDVELSESIPKYAAIRQLKMRIDNLKSYDRYRSYQEQESQGKLKKHQ